MVPTRRKKVEKNGIVGLMESVVASLAVCRSTCSGSGRRCETWGLYQDVGNGRRR